MSNKHLIELLKYSSPYIIYVVNGENRIIKLQTPFELRVMQNIGNLNKNQIVSCTELKITRQGRIVYCINDKNYHTYYFDILTN